MSTGAWIAISTCGLSLVLFIWAQNKLKVVLAALFKINETAQRELSMACKCQDIKTKDPTVPCQDIREESFRTAFMNETKKTTRFSAEKQELQNRFDIFEKNSYETFRKLNLHIQSLEYYACEAVNALPEPISSEFRKKYGNPPVSLKISNGS